MKSVTVTDGKIESAFGFDVKNQPPADKAVTFPITYSYTFNVFENAQEATDAGYSFVKLANTAEKNAAKAKEYQKQISVLKPDQNEPAEVRKRLIRDIMALGKTEAQAEALVDSMA